MEDSPNAFDRASTWHALPADDVVDRLDTEVGTGLDSAEVARRQARWGRNVLTPKKRRGPVVRFLLQFHQPLVYVLLVAAAVTAGLEEWIDAAVIFGVVLINSIVGFVQESKAVQAIEALLGQLGNSATVVRDGQRMHIPAAELVPGDVVWLASGDRVPADLRLVSTKELHVDESALTGESVPVRKSEAAVGASTELPDRSSMAYVSTMVTGGQARGVVTAIGDATEIGHISTLISTAENLQTPLTRKITAFTHMLLFAIIALAAVTFGVNMAHGTGAFDAFMASVALMVGAIPEGLPAAITIMLAMGVSRMAQRRAIIRKLPAVETLGSTTVVCSDKTGTLTENQMTSVRAWAAGRVYELTGTGYAPEGHVEADGERVDTVQEPALQLCLKAGVLCNDSELVQAEGRWGIDGDPTEGALLVSGHKGGIVREECGVQEPRADVLPFESERQYMATLHRLGGGWCRVYVKGSVEAVADRASACLDADDALQTVDRQLIASQAEEMAASGLRVLAFAYRDVPDDGASLSHALVERELVFVGLQGLIDPPREQAKHAIAKCLEAGVRVKMITGDHALTARSIAAQLGLGGKHDADELDTLRGGELARMSDEELQETVERVDVFARVSPEQKLRLVHALQAHDEIVAMTGDGVNDAPALRQANIGIAMGITGTDVAKEASDMVLTDDNFATIEAAVEEGRGVFDNLTKFIVWTLPTNVGEAFLIVTAAALATVLPITPVQILWINMTTAIFLGLMLAFEPKEADIMKRSPRPIHEPILTRDLVMRTLFVGVLLVISGFTLFQLMLSWENPERAARTTAVNAIVFGEMFYLFNCRSLIKPVAWVGWWSNPWIYAGAGTMVAAQVLFTYAPFMNVLFETAPLGPIPWASVIVSGMVIFTLVNLEKRIRLWTGRPAARAAPTA